MRAEFSPSGKSGQRSHRVQSVHAAAIALAAGGCLAGSATRAVAGGPSPVLTPFVVSGQSSSGVAGATYASMENPIINDLGQVAFFGLLTQGVGGVTATTDQCLWVGAPGSLGLVIRDGTTPAAGAAGTTHSSAFTNLRLSGGGHVYFDSPLTGAVDTGTTTGTNRGAWSGTPGSLGLVWRGNSAAPGVAGAVFAATNTGSTPTVNSTGMVAFNGVLRTAVGGVTTNSDRGLWTGMPGALSLVAREGGPATGTIGANFAIVNGGHALNDAGQVAFTATLTGGDTVTANNTGLFLSNGGAVSMVVRKGDNVFGTGGLLQYNSLNTLTMNDAGQILMRGAVAGAGVDSTNSNALFMGAPGSFGVLARQGDAAPGVPGATLGQPGVSTLLLAGGDRFVFSASADDGAGSRAALWHGIPGSISKLVMTGDTAPTSGGSLFGDSFGSVNANTLGQVAFLNMLTGVGVDTSNDGSLWAASPLGDLTLVVREGDLFDVDTDPVLTDLRTISGISLVSGGSVSALNDAGQLAFKLTFTDTSSALVVTTIPIPAPGAIALLSLGCTVMARRRR